MSQNAPKNKTRRRFLLGGLAAGGALVVGWGVQPPRQRLHTAQPLALAGGAVALNGWVAIAPDGTVSVVVPRCEMGQGVNTALPMLLAEELDVPLAQVRISQAPLDKIFSNLEVLRETLPFHPDDRGSVKEGAQWMLAKVAREMGIMMTGGSSSVKDAWLPMREAGAVARAMLIAAAAQEWGVAAAQCKGTAGFVVHPSGKRASYGSLAAGAAAAGLDIGPGDVRLKEPAEFTLIGTPQARRDSPAKVNGSAMFGIDARPPGMLYAALTMSPVVGGKVASFDAAAAKAMPGVVAVVGLAPPASHKTGAGAGVAVIADTYWRARQALGALAVKWDEGANASLSSAAIFKQFASALDTESGFTYYETGDLAAATGAAKAGVKTVSAEYRAPFLAHATMEPVNCTAQVALGKVRLWASTQVPSMCVDMAARVAGVERADVSVEVMLLGGGFGRRLEVDMVGQAVALAMAAGGKPVQLVWSREDDMTHDVYRPAALARFTGSVDAQGRIVAYDNKSASGSIGHQYFPRNLGLPGVGPDKTTAEGEYDMQYEIANQRVVHVIVDSAVPLGYWRSVGHSHNAFFKESFIDELAHAAGQDGAPFRRALLARHPRHLAVLDAALARAGTAPPGRAHGVALHQSFGSIVAQVAEVSVTDKQVRVHRVVCAIDCGLAVNPNIIAQQMESAVVFGLSAALGGEITLNNGRIEQGNFGDYPVLRIDSAPEVETVIIKSAEPPEGVGEPGTPPIAPAVANALFKLTGQRLRSLPLRLA
ncbi:xanthine dehydrogenase family protein molybdopterin-binding subunit [Massilia violaceinigra]|uniref:Xanthine dehydrogenase family protein molybdopterin-binding subunit n=1 Tax=Massilia violaceinigra TaxID=2045208 RepID=A0ABY4A0P0_9BURK|nr:molybdopterin cofactor-binding domain-containing protein [Massilia violaceinigra]UOD28325.1 xanthine dehydrogenase family protein molybdopterin-binding subunit [Massilia violaceinigra]